MNRQIRLENKEFSLQPLTETDFEIVYAAASDPVIWEQHPNKDRWKREVFRTFFEGAIQSGGAYKIIRKSDNAVIGSTRFYDYNAEESSVLIGYTFYVAECWGKGINSQVKALMFDYAFDFVESIYLHVGAENIRSQIAVDRLGAIKTEEREVAYHGELPKQNYIYRLDKGSWTLLRR